MLSASVIISPRHQHLEHRSRENTRCERKIARTNFSLIPRDDDDDDDCGGENGRVRERATLIENSVALERRRGRAAEENTRYTNKTDMPRRKFGDPRNETLGNHLWHGISKRVLILPTTGRPAGRPVGRSVASRRVTSTGRGRVIEFPHRSVDRIKIEPEITFRAEPFYADGLIT